MAQGLGVQQLPREISEVLLHGIHLVGRNLHIACRLPHRLGTMDPRMTPMYDLLYKHTDMDRGDHLLVACRRVVPHPQFIESHLHRHLLVALDLLRALRILIQTLIDHQPPGELPFTPS